MIKKAFRLPKNEIKFLQKKGDLSHSLFFIVKEKENQGKNSKIAVVVSKKISKKAVIRNLIRRRTYEAFRIILKEENLNPKKDFIFIAKKGILEKDFWEIKKDLLKTLKNGQI